MSDIYLVLKQSKTDKSHIEVDKVFNNEEYQIEYYNQVTTWWSEYDYFLQQREVSGPEEVWVDLPYITVTLKVAAMYRNDSAWSWAIADRASKLDEVTIKNGVGIQVTIMGTTNKKDTLMKGKRLITEWMLGNNFAKYVPKEAI